MSTQTVILHTSKPELTASVLWCGGKLGMPVLSGRGTTLRQDSQKYAQPASISFARNLEEVRGGPGI